jgi:ribose transport system ATP-binding protein
MDLIGELRNQGVAIAYITHRMEEMQRLADVVTVLRDGKVVTTNPIAEATPDKIVRDMVGREIVDLYDRAPLVDRRPGSPALRVRNLRGRYVGPFDFDVAPGEVLGLVGLMGSGRTSLLRLLAGADRAVAGTVQLNDALLQLHTPASAVRQGVAFVPEDRKTQGLALHLSVADNLAMTSLADTYGLRVSRRTARRRAETLSHRLGVRCTTTKQPVGQLSGGNQQKVLVGRCLARPPRLVLLDEPTRGVDIGSKADIYALVRQLSEAGVPVVVASSELVEVLGLCHRALVIREGRVAAELAGDDMNEETAMRAATGVTHEGGVG